MTRSKVILFALSWLAPEAGAQALREDLWIANSTVDAVAATDSVVYLAGGFDRLSPATGSSVAISRATGAVRTPYPLVTGRIPTSPFGWEVRAVVPDGHGGWYFGGSFSTVRGVARNGLAQVDAAGNVTAWNPGTNKIVHSLALDGNLLYVGGQFDTLGGARRTGLAAVDATTGAVTAWDPAPGSLSTPVISAIAPFGSTIYVGGFFNAIGVTARNNIAAIDATTGVATAWNPNADGGISALGIRSTVIPPVTTIYAGGSFSNVGGAARANLAALSTTGTAFGWNPAPDGPVRTLFVGNTQVFVGGLFANIGGAARRNVACITNGGGATAWDPSPDGEVNSVFDFGSVYIGGNFQAIGGQARRGVAAVDVTTGVATSWNPNPNNAGVNAVAASDSSVFIGGGFLGMGGVTRPGLGALDAVTGAASPWNPGPQVGRVRSLAVAPGLLYAGGTFSSIAGQPRGKLAVLSTANGAVLPWNPNVTGAEVTEILPRPNGTVIVVGTFQNVNGLPRSNAVAIDAASGIPTAWLPEPDGWTRTIGASGDTIFLGGEFTHIGGQARNHLASVLEAGGSATSWNPLPDPQVSAFGIQSLVLVGPTVHVGGNFEFGGTTRHLGAFDRSTGAPAPAPAADNMVLSLCAVGNTIHAGGDFNQIDGQPHGHVASYEASTGAVWPWDAGVTSRVYWLSAAAGRLFAGGLFFEAAKSPHSYVAGFEVPVVGVGDSRAFRPLMRVLPNPSRGTVAFALDLAAAGPIDASVFDVRGRSVRNLKHGVAAAGPMRLSWDGKDDSGRMAPPGLYFLRITDPSGTRGARIVRVAP